MTLRRAAAVGVWSVAILAAAALLLGGANPAAGAGDGGTQAVVLIHHSHDQVDPFGVAFGDRAGDTFSARYGHLVEDVGRFDFPYLVADGVVAVRAVPDARMPYASTVAAYENATLARLAASPAAALELGVARLGTAAAGQILLSVRVVPFAAVADPHGVQSIHLWAAVTEDAIHYQPPAPVSNGVTEHRFTVRALKDLGAVNLASGLPASVNGTFAADSGWVLANLHVAAWLQADAAPGRFQPHEVLQAVQAPVPESAMAAAPASANSAPSGPAPVVRQAAKAVLVELYSATWCNPCLYGDLAAEQVAIRHANAEPLSRPAVAYGVGIGPVALGFGLAAGASAAWPWRRR